MTIKTLHLRRLPQLSRALFGVLVSLTIFSAGYARAAQSPGPQAEGLEAVAPLFKVVAKSQAGRPLAEVKSEAVPIALDKVRLASLRNLDEMELSLPNGEQHRVVFDRNEQAGVTLEQAASRGPQAGIKSCKPGSLASRLQAGVKSCACKPGSSLAK
jgi:hypothetical protein